MINNFNKLSKYFFGRIGIFCHQNADPDSICSAFALKNLIKSQKNEQIDIILPNQANSLGKKIINYFDIDIINQPHDKYDNIFVVDTGSLNQLKPYDEWIKSFKRSIIFIDHHSKDEEISKLSEYYLINEEATSVSEIIYSLYKKNNQKPTLKTIKVLLCGIAFDSKFFQIGTSSTYKTISELIELGAPINEIKRILTNEMDNSEKIARLKASQRTNIVNVGKWLIVSTEVGSFQASAARGILSLGADLVIVASKEKEKIKASIRSTEKFYYETNLNLGGIFSKELAKEFNGTGGGHSTVAGINAEGDVKKFLEKAIDLIIKTLNYI